MSTHYERTVRFAEVDGAGFVFFAKYLELCHEAYEASLLRAGIELRTFFGANRVLIPIAKTQAQYLGPLQSGDRVRIELAVSAAGEHGYAIAYRVIHVAPVGEKLVALAKTEHVVIDLHSLERKPPPPALAAWIQAGGAGGASA
ncbi:MAG TPA: acyl-CoA thioesterase [Opitutaceae bacterium]